MNQSAVGNGHTGTQGSRLPLGGFLDRVPSGLYAAAHVMFLAVGVWLLTQVGGLGSAYSAAFALYALSQVGFLAYFGHLITMKTAVLTEQTLVLVMVLLIARSVA